MAYTYTNCSNCLLSRTPSVNKARVVCKEISLPVNILKPAKNQYIERTSRNRILYFIFMKWYSILQTTGIFKRVGLFNTNVGIYNSNYRFLSGPKLMIFKVKLAIWKKVKSLSLYLKIITVGWKLKVAWMSGIALFLKLNSLVYSTVFTNQLNSN